jgi:hypothetical protein
VKLKYPSATIAAAMTMGGSGRLIDQAEIFIAIRALPRD